MLATGSIAWLITRFAPSAKRQALATGQFLLASWLGLAAAAYLQLLFPTVARILLQGFEIAMGLALVRLWAMASFRLLLPSLRLNPPRIMEDIVAAVGYIAWGLAQLRYAGLDLSQIVTTSAVITAVIAFSLQDTLGNLLGGLALQLDHSFEIGDWVKADDVIGRVSDITWRATRIETRNGETVVVPNSVLMKSKFSVLGREQGEGRIWRRWIWFEVSIDTLPGEVLSIVNHAMSETNIANVASEPAPNCILMGFEQGVARYALRYWLSDLQPDDPTDSAVRAHLDAALRRHNIHLAAPRRDVLMTKETGKYQDARQKRELGERQTMLHQVDLFSHLTDDELAHLAERLQYSPFVAGDTITRQGAIAHWLYILTKGEAEVWLEQGGQSRLLGRLGAGNFFGEMGLMTGSPRSATVIAKSDVECYRLDKESFQSILLSRQELATLISHTLEKRLAERNAQPQAELGGRSATPHHSELLDRIRSFFGINP